MEGICRAYESKFNGSLVEKVKELVGKRHHTYHKLITAVVKGVRIECHPSEISVNEVEKDTELLFQMLEKNKSFDKVKVVELMVHESWLHINEIAKHYMQYSKFDICTRIETQFGDHSFTFNALHSIIDVSRSRHEYFAKCLQISLKDSTTNGMPFIVLIYVCFLCMFVKICCLECWLVDRVLIWERFVKFLIKNMQMVKIYVNGCVIQPLELYAKCFVNWQILGMQMHLFILIMNRKRIIFLFR